MTLREWIGDHPGTALDVTTPEGRVLLEQPQLQRLREGLPVIAVDGDLRHAVPVPAEDLLEQEVCSAYPVHSLWRLATTYDAQARRVARRPKGMMQWRMR